MHVEALLACNMYKSNWRFINQTQNSNHAIIYRFFVVTFVKERFINQTEVYSTTQNFNSQLSWNANVKIVSSLMLLSKIKYMMMFRYRFQWKPCTPSFTRISETHFFSKGMHSSLSNYLYVVSTSLSWVIDLCFHLS